MTRIGQGSVLRPGECGEPGCFERLCDIRRLDVGDANRSVGASDCWDEGCGCGVFMRHLY